MIYKRYFEKKDQDPHNPLILDISDNKTANKLIQ